MGLGILLACCPCAFPLNPSLDINQYAHTAWKIRDGFTKGLINSIVQTPDGYLWLGTEFGLLRFDGVRTVPWTPPPGQHLPSDYILGLLVTSDGTLWIGARNGLASWKGGKLTQYAELAGQSVFVLLKDREGLVWAGTGWAPTGRLCEIKTGSVQCHGEDGSLGPGVLGLHEDTKGNIWAGVVDGVWRWKPGLPTFYPIPDKPNSVQTMVDTEGGELLIPTRGAVRRLAGRKIETVYPFPETVRQFQAESLLRDREGGLWIGTAGGGLVHVHRGRTDVFRQSDGLSGDTVSRLFEDREGSIWVTTVNGLDRFRDVAVPTFSVNQGLSNATVGTALAAKDGSVWFSTFDSVNRWRNGQFTVYRERLGRAMAGVHEITGTGAPDYGLTSLFQDVRGRIWIATRTGIGYLDNDRFIAINDLPGGQVSSIAEDSGGNLWFAYQNAGLFRLSPDNEVQRIPWAALGNQDFALALAADTLQGGLWLGFSKGGVSYFTNNQVRASFAAADGLGAGSVADLRLDPDGTLWAATEGGLSRLKNGRVATLTRKSGLPCDTVQWILEDDGHSFWLNTACGLVRIARSDLDAWASDPSHTTKAMVFDSSDGVRSRASLGGYTPHAAKSLDGRLWFAGLDGINVVDPRHLPYNKLPPPVHVETVKVNGEEVAPAEAMELSHSSNDLEIRYTALSLTIPERVRFRYKLEGKDKEWQDAGTRRQAFYGGLAPKKYRFRVMASNNDGVWNEAGASWNFTIVPAFYQTIWFRGLSVLAVAGLTWLLYRLRLQQATARVNLLYNERLAERTRVARDLHDTLLQSLAGVSLQLEGISKRAAPETASLIGRVREQVDSAFREARTKVWNLRSTSLEVQGLEGALRQLVERVGAGMTARCGVSVSGQPRPCPPEVEEELLRIAQEATNNANQHAQAKEIRIALEYSGSSLTLSISDDGCGFDFEEGYGKSGHWGLKNMQERATQIRGTCKITTAAGQGTRIEIRVPISSWFLRNTVAKGAHSSSGG
jgi:signal transduction histidine kinase/ligand-binding sensor domain-containing protein